MADVGPFVVDFLEKISKKDFRGYFIIHITNS